MRWRNPLTVVAIGLGATGASADGFNGVLAGKCGSNGTAVFFNLRQDFSDLNGLACPVDAAKAIGARLSFTRDEIASKDSLSVDGLATLAVEYHPAPSSFQGLDLGVFVQGSGMLPLNQTNASVTDTITSGGFIAVAVGGPIGRASLDNVFRVRGGDVTGNQGIGSHTFVAEWEPVYNLVPDLDLYHHWLFTTAIGYTFDPELMLQYDHLDDVPNKYLIFATSKDSARLGPQFVLRLFAGPDDAPTSLAPLLDRLVLSLTYHASWDMESRRQYNWFQPALTFNLDPEGHVALSASYGLGNAEATGNVTKQAKLALAAKF